MSNVQESAASAAESQEASSPEESAQLVEESIDGEESAEESFEAESTEKEASESTDEELAETVQDTDATQEEKQEAALELKKRLMVKINGKEQEREIDFTDDDFLREMIQKGESADQKFQESAQIKKQMEQLAKIMKEDPIEALKRLGHNVDDLTQNYMENRIKQMEKSPEQLELEQLRQEIENERKEKERLAQEKLEAEQTRIQENYSRQLDQEITDVLQTSELPKSPYVVKRIAENLMLLIDKGQTKAQVKDVMPLVEKQIKGEIRQMFEAMPEDVVEKILGNDVSNKLRKRRIKKMKKVPETATSIKQTGNTELKASKSTETTKKMKSKDFWSNVGDY